MPTRPSLRRPRSVEKLLEETARFAFLGVEQLVVSGVEEVRPRSGGLDSMRSRKISRLRAAVSVDCRRVR
jgi:hypothetical protein